VRIAVLGHVEWVEFAHVDHVPASGEIVHARPALQVPAGGGGVAAVHLARWGADTALFAALGDDALGHRAADELRARNVRMHATFRAQPQRRALTLIDRARDRTIIVLGDRMSAHGADPLPWHELATCDAVYITSGDIPAIRHARRARIVVGTSRIVPALRDADIELDALVGSTNDPAERYTRGDLARIPRLSVRTDGDRGGTFELADGTRGTYEARVAPITGDTYGAGDTFAAALTFALAEGREPTAALALAAERAAEVVAFTGPYPERV
jgi:ribokinase